MDEVPLRLAQLIALTPLETHPQASDLVALLAQLLALARGQGGEEVAIVAIAAVMPVELAAKPRQPTVAILEQGIGLGIGEVHMQAGELQIGQAARGGVEQRRAAAGSPSRRAPCTGEKGTAASSLG